MGRKTTLDSIAEVYADSGADVDEMHQLRTRIAEVQEKALEQGGSGGVVEATCKSFDVTRLLVEQGIFKTRHRGHDPVDQAQLRSVVEANVAYLQATLSAMSDQRPPE